VAERNAMGMDPSSRELGECVGQVEELTALEAIDMSDAVPVAANTCGHRNLQNMQLMCVRRHLLVLHFAVAAHAAKAGSSIDLSTCILSHSLGVLGLRRGGD
jgi:hypothetical protein